jgi:phosphate:Na+ symporter
MSTTLTLVDLAGAVALLLWGVHMVQTGVQRAFGADLRRLLGLALRSRPRAFAAGLGVTGILQSSTATGLMVASFAAAGLVDLVPALAAMLGANVGTTLIVQALSFNVTQVAPLLILIGVMNFRRANSARARDLGRVAIGLGLMLLALEQVLALVTPYEDVPSLRLLLGSVATEPAIAIVLAAALTWAAHSSVAVILLVMSFAAKGVVPPDAAFALVLGANLGTAINPLLEGAGGADGTGRRLPLGNLLNRLVGCALALAALPLIAPRLVALVPDIAQEVAVFHTAFNLLIALIFLPLLGPFAALLRCLVPARAAAADPGKPVYLGDADLESPAIAIANAARESLRMADLVEAMLRAAGIALEGGDRQVFDEARRLENTLDRLNTAIKTYATSLDPDALTEGDHRRLAHLMAFTTNLEHAGDVLDRNVLPAAAKRLKRGLAFSPEARAEIAEAIERLTTNLRIAADVFMTSDPAAARRLAAQKGDFREMESRATIAHLAALRDGGVPATQSSTLRLDLLRDLKRVNTHLVAAGAYPVLEEGGDLLPTRLRQSGDDAAQGETV